MLPKAKNVTGNNHTKLNHAKLNHTEDKNKEIFETMPVPKALATLAIPTIIGQLVVLIYNLADTFYIGRTNNPLMVAGASLILPVYNICISIAGLAGVGGGTLISRLLGAGNEAEAKRVSAFSFYLSIGLSLFFSIAVMCFMHPLLMALGASGDTYDYARQYAFCVIVLGALPTVMSVTMSNLLRSVSCAKQAGFGVSMGGIINIFLDPIFMFVLFPAGMETAAAGIATMCSNMIVCIYYLVIILRLRDSTVLTFSMRSGLPEMKSIYSILFVGIPASLATLLFDLAYVVIDKLATGYGDIPLAAVGIVLKAERLPLNVGIGLCQGMMPIAAYNYTSGNHERMKKAVSLSRIAGLVIAALSIVMYESFAGNILRFFINDAQTIQIGANFLRVRCLATPFMFMCFHLVNLFQAVGKGNHALFLAVVRWAVFNIPMLFLFNAVFGMYGIVCTQMIADICTAVVSFYVYHRFERSIAVN